MKTDLRKILILSTMIPALAAVFAVSTSLALYVKDAESDGSSGRVALRSYYERGTGTELDPYIITRPRHLYNFSRLHALGVYDDGPHFWKLGFEDGSGVYEDDESSTKTHFIDMKDSRYDYEPIIAIGSESSPFKGFFDGQNNEIKNLTVYADPEDAGLFGYTAHGSIVQNIFLDNITINTMGYTSTYASLYSPSSPLSSQCSYTYVTDYADESKEDIDKTFDNGENSGEEAYQTFDASDYFDWDGEGDAPEVVGDLPTITYHFTDSSFDYENLLSGGFLKSVNKTTVTIDLPYVFEFFREQKEEAEKFPITAASSVSILASKTDDNGLRHSKVVLSLEFVFEVLDESATEISMGVHLGPDHGNNIGLIAGHCDGSVTDCYVHNGHFVMNNGTTPSGETHYNLANGSNNGLIGLVGNTVHNLAAEESEASAKTGKDVGVLDFTTIYNDISPTGFASYSGNYKYTPRDGTKYGEFLRIDTTGKYVTLENNSISLNRKRVVKKDLGIFTVATDNDGTGMGADAFVDLADSVIRKEPTQTAIDGKYYLYYTTGEYQAARDGADNFNTFRDSMVSNTPSKIHQGHYLPSAKEISSDSFDKRESEQNYIFRFTLDPSYRKSHGFYFSDIDKTKPGGGFLSKYFEHKLVDQNGLPVTKKLLKGVMLRNGLGTELTSITSSFSTPDLSSGIKMYTIDNADEGYPAANMVNFEIKTARANVTVVSANSNPTLPSAVGIYRIDPGDYVGSGDTRYINQAFDHPDYAFFMPKDDQLSYFDYRVNNSGVGEIGTYVGETFEEATIHTKATMPKEYGYGTEFGYASGKTRLYVHTFLLPEGRYCIGAPTGTSINAEDGLQSVDLGVPKIYFVGAQGQTDGTYELNANVFTGNDQVANIDFLKKARFTYNEDTELYEETVTLEGHDLIYNPSDTNLQDQRCYVALANSDRSYFEDTPSPSHLDFIYGKEHEEDLTEIFMIQSDTMAAISRVVVTNYGKSYGLTNSVTDLDNLIVKVLNKEKENGDTIVYSNE